jgi:signal transduction histidine kinase
MKTDSMSNQLRWVILLLAAAVILPTVCLLWFMNQAVKNERLATRQKLIDFYTLKAQFFFVEAQDKGYTDLFSEIQHKETAKAHDLFSDFAVDPLVNTFQGMLIYDSTAELIYPLFESSNTETIQPTSEPLPNLHLENTKRIYQLCYPENSEEISPSRAADIMRYRVFLAKRYQETQNPDLIYHLRKMLIYRKRNSSKENWFLHGPAETTVWQLEKMIEIAQRSGLASRLDVEIQSARNRIKAYSNVIDISPLYSSAASLQNWPNQTIRRLSPESEYYGLKFNLADKTILGVSKKHNLLWLLDAATQNMQDDTIDVQISDNYGTVIVGDETIIDKPFLTLKAGKYLPDFTVSLFFKDDTVFEKAARQQTRIYLWTGLLVTLLVLATGGISIRAVSRQIQMNRLKNDFIATVTHELKTPLSSMRLLVDTLLEGNYRDEQTVPEYLGLIANENERLSHLIDSFLTFSRMERNKQVFEIAPVSPVEVAKQAAEAVRTKFDNGNVTFEMDIQKALPMIHADKDGMITVLVNLLDNAYKYSNSDKQIQLNVYQQNGIICFAVKDNGIGISKRVQKRIFNRFYQVDSRLSRTAEGCGLGLSIVKFVVDAHKGTIDVESQPGQGSTFRVKLPQC